MGIRVFKSLCGIAGVMCIAEECKIDEDAFVRSLLSLEHRGPDGYGYWISKDKRFAFGNTRLAIIDPTDEALQPMFNEDGSIGIVMNGEIYNYKELREELKNDHELLTSSDTETVLHAYEEYGQNVFARLRGPFAIALWHDGKLILARDHIGKRPLYYYYDNNLLMFASEPIALWKYFGQLKVDPVSMSYVALHVYPPSPKTLYEGVRSLPKGHYILLDGALRINRYYSINFNALPKMSDIKAYLVELKRALREALKYHMVADVPIALSLSSGVDSTLIAGMVVKDLKREDLTAFTIGSVGGEDEVEVASEVAKELGLEHKVVLVNLDKYLNDADYYIRKTMIPPIDPSAVLIYNIAKSAKSLGFKVMLVGEGGDELFIGYPVYSSYSKIFELLKDIPKPLADVLCLVPNPRACYLHLLYYSIPRTLTSPSLCPINEKYREMLIYALRSLADSLKPRNFIEEILATEYSYRIPDHLTLKVDISAMLAGVEARSPLLDHKLIEVAHSLHPLIKKIIASRMVKYFGKLLLNDYYSKALVAKITKKKIGFGTQILGILKEASEIALEEYKDSTYMKQLFPYDVIHKEIKRGNSFLGWIVYILLRWEELVLANSP